MNRLHAARPSSARSIRALAIVLALVMPVSLVAIGDSSDQAHAEGCSSTGLQPRVLVTDDPGFIETQFCLDHWWVTTSRMQVAPDVLTITEPVWDPRDDRYRLSAAEAFFGVRSRDPFATVDSIKGLLDKSIDASELLELKLALADSAVQALKNRRATSRSDGCQTRSVPYSALSRRLYNWLGPTSIAPADQPTQIDFEFAPGVPTVVKIAVLNAVEQYSAAVAAQDIIGRYPSKIVPHDPKSSRRATITFTHIDPEDSDKPASTEMRYGPIVPGTQHRWQSGEIGLSDIVDPQLVGHEIGHVLGIDHLPTSDYGTMREPIGGSLNWSPRIPLGEGATEAFDPCMFLPPVGE